MFEYRLNVILEADGPTRRDFLQRSAAAVSVGPSALAGVVDSLGGFKSLNALAERAWLNSSVFKHLSKMSKATRNSLRQLNTWRYTAGDDTFRQQCRQKWSKLSPEDQYAIEMASSWWMLGLDGSFASPRIHSYNLNKPGYLDLLIKEAGGSKQFLRLFCNDIVNNLKDQRSERIEKYGAPKGKFGRMNEFDLNPVFEISTTLRRLIEIFGEVSPSLKSLLGGFDVRIFDDHKVSFWQAESKFMDLMHKRGVISDAEYHNISQSIKADSMDPTLADYDTELKKEIKRQRYDSYKYRNSDEYKKIREANRKVIDNEKKRRQESEALDSNAISRWEDEGGALPKDLEESINNLLSIII